MIETAQHSHGWKVAKALLRKSSSKHAAVRVLKQGRYHLSNTKGGKYVLKLVDEIWTSYERIWTNSVKMTQATERKRAWYVKIFTLEFTQMGCGFIQNSSETYNTKLHSSEKRNASNSSNGYQDIHTRVRYQIIQTRMEHKNTNTQVRIESTQTQRGCKYTHTRAGYPELE